MTFHCKCGVPERECDFPKCAPDRVLMAEPIHNLRLEKSNDRWVLCGNILPVECITPGQRWQGSGGGVVIVDRIIEDQVYYFQSDGTTHNKGSFAFQCRYSLIIGG